MPLDAKAIAVTKQPSSYQEMLNYLMPTKATGGQTFVPRITTNSATDAPSQLNDFDHWRGGGKNPHAHIGADLGYSKLNSTTGNVDYVATTNAVNQNVSIGAPVGGIMRIVKNSSTNEVLIETPAGLVFSVMHMSGIDASLDGKLIAPGTPLGVMDGVGAGGVKHAHLSVFQNEKIIDSNGIERPSRVYYDPQEVMTLGTTGRYVIKDNSGMTPDRAVDSTPASEAFWRNNTNANGEGQREVTACRTIADVGGVRTVTSTYGGQTVTGTYDAAGKATGGQPFVNDFNHTQGGTGNWLQDAQARQNQSIQAALSVVLPAEAYRANIYNDGTGIPTVGYGYALLDKLDGGGYRAKTEAEVRTSLRLAGVDDTAINSIPFRSLERVAEELNAGKRGAADALTATLTDTKVFANQDQAQIQVANRLATDIPGLVKALGGAEVAADLNTNQMGALLSLYDNSPKLIGANLVAAIKSGNTDAVLFEIEVNSNKAGLAGIDVRRIDEAALFTNTKPVSGGTFTSGGGAKAPAGHWEDIPAKLDELGNQIMPAERVWVADKPSVTDLRNNANDPGRLDLPTDDKPTPPTDDQDPSNASSVKAVNGLDKASDEVIPPTAGEQNEAAKVGLFANPAVPNPPADDKVDDTRNEYDKQSDTYTPPKTESDSAFLQNEPQNNNLPNDGTFNTNTNNLPKYTLGTGTTGSGINLASAGGGIMTDAGLMGIGGGTGATPLAPPSLASQLSTTDLTPQQQQTLLTQLTQAGAGTKDAQLIPLQTGGYLIANSEGDLVGSTNPLGTNGLQSYTTASGQSVILAPKGGIMSAAQATVFEATGIDLATPIAQQYNQTIQGALSGYNASAAFNQAAANWQELSDLQRASALLNAYNSASQLSASPSTPAPIINEDGKPSPQSPPATNYAGQAAALVNLLQSAQNLGNWDKMSDMQRAQTLAGTLASSNAAMQSFGTGSASFGQSAGQFAAGLSLLDALNTGSDRAILTSGLQFANSFNGAVDQIISNWVSSAATDAVADAAVGAAAQGAAGNTVPYVAIAMAAMNFEKDPGQAIGSIIGSCYFGPLGGMVGGMIGSAIGGALGFGKSDPPPPPVGIAALGWDESGDLKVNIEFNQSGAGANASAMAKNVQAMLEQITEQVNAKNPDTPEGHLKDIAINPYCVPRFGVDRSGAWIETVQVDGSTFRENIVQETFSTRLIEILQQNGGLAPAWQVETIKEHYQAEAQNNPAEARIHAAESADFKTQTFGARAAWKAGASPNNGGLTPKESQVLQAANQGATGSVPNWLGRVAARAMTEWAAGLYGLEAANDVAWRLVA